MAITTSLKRSSLEDAWDCSPAGEGTLRGQLRAWETAARRVVAGGSLASTGSNSRSVSFAGYGPGQVTPVEMAELWRELIDLHDRSKTFLERCATYGLDAEDTELDGEPSPLPDPVAQPAAVTDQSIYDWMMNHLIAVTEIRHDFSELRIR